MHYRLVMDHTWLFVPTGHIQIQPNSFTFPASGHVQVLANSVAVPLYADADLNNPKGTDVSYPAGSGFLDYWFWANFQPGTASVVLRHTNGSTLTTLSWTVSVQCNNPGGLSVAPDSAFEIAGTVGGPFAPASRNYGLTNSASSTIGYSISVSYTPASAAGWLSLSRTSGSLGAGQSTSFTATVTSSANGLAAGTYGATIEVHTSGTTPQTITRAVSLSIAPPPVISGRITTPDGAPLEGVRMTGLPSVRWTDENGEYSEYVGTGWSGTVRPVLAGFSFSPSSRTYSAITAGLSGQDYFGTAKTYTLSGRVTLDGAGLPGVTMTGLSGDPVTDDSGNYSAIVPFHWSGTVVPSAPGYVFSPDSKTYSEVGMDLVEENYLAVRRMVTISGRVTYGSSGLAGAWLNGLPGSVVTAADGTYTAAVPYGTSGTMTPGANGYTFSPPSIDFADLTEDLPGQDFTAFQAPPGSGRLWIVATSAALNNAAVFSLAGDMILVKPGTYLGVNLGSLDPGTILVSEAGADQTILEVGQFVVNMSDVVIEGFTFRTNGTSEPLHITGSSNVRLRNCRIIAPGTTYGVRITNAQNLLIEGTVFSGYAGILLRSGTSAGTLTLRNNNFLNQAFGLLGGSNPSLQVILENNLFRNIAQEGVDLDKAGSLITRNNLFIGNGSGLRASSIPGAVQLTQDTLVGNSKGYETSGTISLVIYNAILQGNDRGINGSGNATLSIHHLMHWQNTSGWLYGSANYILDESTIWEADPRFVNASGGDYRLASNSPARGVGQGGVDLGAYGGALGNAWKIPPGAPPAPPALLAIVITGPERANPGDIPSLTAKASFANGYVSPYTTFNSVAQWSSSDSSVLESQGAGKFQAIRPGTATVTAQSGSVSATWTVTILAPALLLAATDTADPVTAGGTVTYELSVTNYGQGIARNLQVTAQFDARTSFVSASPAPDVGTTNRWTLDNLQPGATAEISVTVSVNTAAAGTTLSFSANATADFATIASASEATAVSSLAGLDFYTLLPCRVLDTRPSSALVSGVPRSVPVAGLCGVPPTAQAVVLNLTVVSPSGSGYVSLWPADLPWPQTSMITFSTGQARSNNAIVGLATDGGGDLAAQAFVGGAGTVHLVLDVSGYFQ
ncbi:MAG TPA: right-handed parallel beta-helix repeat-containing protein [Thermoanaerobaculia bacterium]|nr:right-handed parallel beta-helix repeat-containing protein [Thermoanaerobaculia bacterium]